MSDTPTMKEWVQWYEVSEQPRGTPEELESELRDLIRKVNPTALLALIAQLSVAFGYGPGGKSAEDTDVASPWFQVLFPPHLVPRVVKFAQEGRIIFFQGQLRFLALEVMRVGVHDDASLPVMENRRAGELLLRAGEQLYRPHEEQTERFDQLANRISQMLPIYELDPPNDAVVTFLRFYIFLTVNIQRLKPEYKRYDIPKMFEDKYGIDIETFAELLIAFAMHATAQRDDKSPFKGTDDCGIRMHTFQKSNTKKEQLEKMFSLVAFSWDSLKSAPKSDGYADFDILRDTPYFHFKDAIYCLDFEFALGKLESNALWRMIRKMSDGQVKEFFSFWGYVLEDYVAWLFEQYSKPEQNQYYPSPKYRDKDGNEFCDVVVVCGETAILIECKLATCKSTTRYSGKFRPMKDYLEDRLVKDHGVSQLLRAIEDIGSLPPDRIPDCVRDLKKFIPLIITRDDIGSSWFVNEYLNERFQEGIKKKEGISVTPLVCMSLGTLERCMNGISQKPFSEILEDRLTKDLRWTFEMGSSFVGPGTASNIPSHFKVLGELVERFVKTFELKN